MRSKITKSLVDSLQAGQTVTDTDLDGFRVRVGKTGKIYSIQKRVGHRVLTRTIGRHGIYTPDEARKAAKGLLLKLSQGVDPQEEKLRTQRREAITFGHLVQLYLEKRSLAESTKRDIKSKVGKQFHDWLDLPAANISRQMALAKHERLMKIGPTQAALLARYAKAIFNFGIGYYSDDRTGESLLPQNPITVINTLKQMPRAVRRQTFLDSKNLKPWFAAWQEVRREHPTPCDYLVTTLLLGCRRSEAARLLWEEVDFENRTVCFTFTKNRTDHVMPTGNYLTDLLRHRYATRHADTRFVFPARTGHGHLVDARAAMEKICELAGVNFMLSDLRRTFATHAVGIGVDYFDVKRLLNHKADNREATPGYIVTELNRKKVLVQLIEDFILKAAGMKPAPVLPIRTALTKEPSHGSTEIADRNLGKPRQAA